MAIIIFSCGFAQAQNELTIITEDYPPLNYVEEGQLKGPAVDIVEKIKSKLNITTEIRVPSWERGYRMLNAEDNIVLFSITRTDTREKLFKWVGPLARGRYGFFAKKNSGIKLASLNDSEKYQVGVQINGGNEQLLRSKGFTTNLSAVSSPIQNFTKLMRGRIDLWYTDSATVAALTLQEKSPPGGIEELLIITKSELYIGFSKNTSDEVISAWQNAYDDLYRDGTIHRIFSQYNLSSMEP